MEEMLKSLLLKIARNLDDHIKDGQPYDLTFFYDKRVPLTSEQKQILVEWLAYHFRDIWGNTWIKMEADALRVIADNVKEHAEVTKVTLDKEGLIANDHINYMLYH